jgi:hypothetical protein
MVARCVLRPPSIRGSSEARLAAIHAGDPVGPGERHARHRCCLDRQRDEVLGLEVVDMRLPARARECAGDASMRVNVERCLRAL